MERVPLDGQNGGRQCEYEDNINADDVVSWKNHGLSVVPLKVPYRTGKFLSRR